MLEETKKIYEEQANFIKDWKNINKNQLCNLYIQNENDSKLANCYLSAIILNYWNKIYTLYSKTYLTASYEDAYDWIIEGILYALKHRRWLDKDSSIYNDPNGPDKAINRKIKCIRLNFLSSQNRQKRKLRINLLSLDSLEDSDNFIGEYNQYIDYYKDIIYKLYINNLKNESIILDLILNEDCFVKKDNQIIFNINNLSNIIQNLSIDIYSKYFSVQYNLNYYDVFDSIQKLKNNYALNDLWNFGQCFVEKNRVQINKFIKQIISNLKKNQEIKDLLC